jgi:uncharacterized protein (TIGR02611 family)
MTILGSLCRIQQDARIRGAHLRSNRDEKVLMKSLQQTKRFLKVLFGFTLLVAGILMIVTPGPGWLTIMLALGVLAAEFVWARRLLDRMKQQGLRLRDSVLPREKPGSA